MRLVQRVRVNGVLGFVTLALAVALIAPSLVTPAFAELGVPPVKSVAVEAEFISGIELSWTINPFTGTYRVAVSTNHPWSAQVSYADRDEASLANVFVTPVYLDDGPFGVTDHAVDVQALRSNSALGVYYAAIGQ